MQDTSGVSKRDNPHKYLLYKPTFDQLYTFLSSGFKELPSGGATLLYISSDGCASNSNQSEDSKSLFPLRNRSDGVFFHVVKELSEYKIIYYGV